MNRQQYHSYSHMSQAQAYRDPLRRVQGSGGTGNKSSQDNPLNTVNDQDYNNLTAASQEWVNIDSLKRAQGSGGPGNKSSQDNPLNTINDQDYNNLTAVSQNLANQDPLRRVAQARSVQTSNVSSGDNPLNPSTYNRPTTKKRQI